MAMVVAVERWGKSMGWLWFESTRSKENNYYYRKKRHISNRNLIIEVRMVLEYGLLVGGCSNGVL